MRDLCAQVFGPETTQATLYEQGIQPVVQEVLAGFNCTVFAYGQTGTGAHLRCRQAEQPHVLAAEPVLSLRRRA